jgi:hypothetical protein
MTTTTVSAPEPESTQNSQSPPPTPIPEALPLAEEDLEALDEVFKGIDIDTDGMETIIVFE